VYSATIQCIHIRPIYKVLLYGTTIEGIPKQRADPQHTEDQNNSLALSQLKKMEEKIRNSLSQVSAPINLLYTLTRFIFTFTSFYFQIDLYFSLYHIFDIHLKSRLLSEVLPGQKLFFEIYFFRDFLFLFRNVAGSEKKPLYSRRPIFYKYLFSTIFFRDRSDISPSYFLFHYTFDRVFFLYYGFHREGTGPEKRP
jgi:hypothetical protein